MNGDRHKPQNTFIRWLEFTSDGIYTLKKGERIPSGALGKGYNKRWQRRQWKSLKRKMDYYESKSYY